MSTTWSTRTLAKAWTLPIRQVLPRFHYHRSLRSQLLESFGRGSQWSSSWLGSSHPSTPWTPKTLGDSNQFKPSPHPTTPLSPVAQSIPDTLNLLPFLDTSYVFTISVSGGCDSVALLHAVMEGYRHSKVEIHVVHFHHRQRGKDADEDCQFVQDLCRHYQIACHVEDWKDQPSSGFGQEAARNWRRQRLLEKTKEWTNQRRETNARGIIFTGHHQEDSYETICHKLLRGVHLLRLTGIPRITALDSEIWLLRPFVQTHKQDLIDYLQNNTGWREDASNTSPKYLRNRIRHELLPLLQDLSNGQFYQRLDHWMEQSSDMAQDVQPRVESYLEQVVDEDGNFHWKDDDNSWIASQALYQWMTQPQLFISYETLKRVVQQVQKSDDQWTLDLGQGWKVQRNGSVLQMVNGPTNEEWKPWTWSLNTCDDALSLSLPADWVGSNLTIWQTTVEILQKKPGNQRFTPPWRSSPIQLRQFLRGQGVPLHRRDHAPVLVANVSGECRLLAVHVESWIVNKDYRDNGSHHDAMAIMATCANK